MTREEAMRLAKEKAEDDRREIEKANEKAENEQRKLAEERKRDEELASERADKRARTKADEERMEAIAHEKRMIADRRKRANEDANVQAELARRENAPTSSALRLEEQEERLERRRNQLAAAERKYAKQEANWAHKHPEAAQYVREEEEAHPRAEPGDDETTINLNFRGRRNVGETTWTST